MHPIHRAYLISDTPVSGPYGIAVRGIGTTAQLAIGFDAVRHAILFHNPNPGVTLRVLPEGEPLMPRVGGLVLEPYGYLLLTDSTGGNLGEDWARVRLNCGWQVVADEDGPPPPPIDLFAPAYCPPQPQPPVPQPSGPQQQPPGPPPGPPPPPTEPLPPPPPIGGGMGLTIWDFADSRVDSLPGSNGVNRTANLNIDVEIRSPMGRQFSNLTTRSMPIMEHLLNRRGVLFHNPGTCLKAVSPGNLDASLGPGSVILPPGKHLEIRHGGKIRCNVGFNAVSEDNGDPHLTVLEYV